MDTQFNINQLEVHPGLNLIKQGSETIKLSPKEMQLLLTLYKSSPVPVSKDELVKTLWQNRVGSHDLVARLVADLRKKLSDDPRNPEYVETVIKKGYRLLYTPDVEIDTRQPIATPKNLLLLFLTLILISVIIFSFRSQDTTSPTYKVISAEQIGSDQQYRYQPSFSDDGKFVIFTEFHNGHQKIMLYDIKTKTTQIILSSDNFHFFNASLSPENKIISYTKIDDNYCEVGIFEILTKKTTKLIECDPTYAFITKANWNDSGNKLILSKYNSTTKNIALVEIDLASTPIKATEIYTSTDINELYYYPSYFDQRGNILFCKTTLTGPNYEISVLNRQSGKTRLLHSEKYIKHLAKSSDTIYFSVTDGKAAGIKYFTLNDTDIKTLIVKRASYFDIRDNSPAIIYAEREFSTDMFFMKDNKLDDLLTTPLDETSVTIDRHRDVIYYTNEQGELWESDLDSGKKHLLKIGEKDNSLVEVALSPTGSKMMLTFVKPDGMRNIKIIDINTKNIIFSVPFSQSQQGQWLSDDKIIFQALEGRDWRLYSMQTIAGAKPSLIFQHEVLHFNIDNNILYYSQRESRTIYSYSLDSSEQKKYENILPTLAAGYYWSISNNKIIYLEHINNASHLITRSLASNQESKSVLLGDLPLRNNYGFYFYSHFSNDKDVFISLTRDDSSIFLSELKSE